MKQYKIGDVFTDSENFNPPKRLKCVAGDFELCWSCAYLTMCQSIVFIDCLKPENVCFIETDEPLTE